MYFYMNFTPYAYSNFSWGGGGNVSYEWIVMQIIKEDFPKVKAL